MYGGGGGDGGSNGRCWVRRLGEREILNNLHCLQLVLNCLFLTSPSITSAAAISLQASSEQHNKSRGGGSLPAFLVSGSPILAAVGHLLLEALTLQQPHPYREGKRIRTLTKLKHTIR